MIISMIQNVPLIMSRGGGGGLEMAIWDVIRLDP